MANIVDGYFKLLRAIVVFCLVMMVILVFGNVVLRYGFNTGITLSEELSRWFFVWLTFIGAIVAFHKRAHLGMDSVVSRLPPLGKKICLVTSELLMLYATWLFLSGSWTQTIINLHVTAPASGWSMAFIYGVGVVFSISVGGILLHSLFRVLTGRATEAELIQIKESEDEAHGELIGHELEAPPASASTGAKR